MLTPLALIQATRGRHGRARLGAHRQHHEFVGEGADRVAAPVRAARGPGLTGVVAGVAREVAGRGVTINNLLPGAFATDRLLQSFAPRAAKAGVDSGADDASSAAAAIPAGRFGEPAEFGATCAFLCSVHAGYITGQNVLIDGGAYPGVF